MNKKNSILFQINIIFIIILTIINILIITQFIIENKTYNILNDKRYFNGLKTVEEAKRHNIDEQLIKSQLDSLNLSISKLKLEFLKENASNIVIREDEPINIYYYKNKKYFHFRFPTPPEGKHSNPHNEKVFPFPPKKFDEKIKDNLFPPSKKLTKGLFEKMGPPPPNFLEKINKDLVFIDKNNQRTYKYFWYIVLAIINIMLISFLIFLRKKIKPLYLLKDEIKKFSNGDLSINTKNTGKDEISQVANEFDKAISQLKELRKTKNLFLRNIMHELKTPITKGKLISDTLENGRKKEILKKAFLRLEFLLEEFARLDKITSGKIHLNKKEYRFIDILDQAMDMLLFDTTKIDIITKNVTINVDFEIFSIAIKNLIDNAIKYNTNGNPKIIIEKNKFTISNKADVLKKPFNDYLTPFNREYESIDQGLGLGLYITNSIIKNHGFKFTHEYKDGYHRFIINF